MIEDLKKDTILWEKEQRERRSRQPSHRSNAAGPGTQKLSRKRGYEPSPDIDNLAYVDSKTHERRQIHGPTVPETPSPGLSDGYPPGRGPPMGYPPQQPSPQHEAGYPGRGSGSAGYPSNSSSPGFTPGYPAAAGSAYQNRPSQEYGGYPADHGFGGSSFGGQPPMGTTGRGYVPQPSQTVPPGAQRYVLHAIYNIIC